MVTIHVTEGLTDSVIPAGKHTVMVAEWQLDSGVQPVPQLPWEAFPAAAECIAAWVVEQARTHPGHVILLATRIPQELAVGLGIQLGQLTHSWPRRMYPAYYAQRRLGCRNSCSAPSLCPSSEPRTSRCRHDGRCGWRVRLIRGSRLPPQWLSSAAGG